MCDIVGEAYRLSRRRVLGGLGATAAASALVPLATRAEAATTPKTAAPRRSHASTRLVLLGTAAGPVWWDTRRGMASAIVVDGRAYVVDCGDGAWSQYRRAGLGPENQFQTLTTLEAVFFTHMHSDHTVDYNNLLLFAGASGAKERTRPIQVFGPGDRGSLPPLFGSAPEPRLVNPAHPTPGIATTTDLILQAYANDLNDRLRDARHPDPAAKFSVHDIPLPPEVVAGANELPAPPMAPVTVLEDDRVKVTATLVDHAPTFPAFAFRFDTDAGSIVFSGDTAVSQNLIDLAVGADILVHEVIDVDWVESLFEPPYDSFEEAIIQHLLASHTTIDDVGHVAERAGVDTLVLSHLAPGDNPKSRWLRAGRNFSGRLVVGEDLMEIPLDKRA